jgi:hypothetical protein
LVGEEGEGVEGASGVEELEAGEEDDGDVFGEGVGGHDGGCDVYELDTEIELIESRN